MILVTQNGDNYEIRFPYDSTIVELVKQVPTRTWHPEEKFWSIPKARLGFLVAQFKGTVYEEQLQIQSDEDINVNASINEENPIPDIDISDITLYVQDGFHVFQHQKDMLKFAKWRSQNGLKSGFILADQPGCISGDADIWINEEHSPATRPVKLSTAYKLFHSGKQFKVKSMCNGRFAYFPILDILDKGERECITLHLENGKSLTCTPDHEIYTTNGWIEARNLTVNDSVLCNGKQACPKCGSTDNLVSYKYSKFLGYCRSCMYRLRKTKWDDHWNGESIVKRLDEWGYVRLFGPGTWDMPSYHTVNGMGVYEHHQVWYENTGHVVDTTKEIVHHINHDKADNRFENLQLMTIEEHGRLHSDTFKRHLPSLNPDNDFYFRKGVKIWLVPNPVKVISIEDAGVEHVYDIMIKDEEIHNFIANNMIVHNCGKTLQTMLWAMYLKEKHEAKHCLIIACVNSAKYNWREDIIKHTNGKEEPYILGSRLKRDGSINYSGGSQEKLDDLKTMKMYGGKTNEPLPYFIILNIEGIRMKKGRVYPIAERLIELIDKGQISLIALDEIHRNTSMKAQQGKQLLKIKTKCQKQIQWMPITGTPITSKPTDVFLPLRLVDGHTCNSSYTWNQNYCIYGGFGGHEIIGYKNVPQLKSILQPNMLRRLKKDFLDLPPKIHYTEYIENSDYQQKLYTKIETDMITERERIVKSLNPLAQFLHLRQVNGSPELVDQSISPDDPNYLTKNAKLKRLLELLDDILEEPSEKVVIFSNWVEPLRTLHKYIGKKYKLCCYTGTMAPDAREQHKQAFINDLQRRVMIGTIGALGTSHTLTVARNVIFYDSPWNPADIEQAEDRCHRPGTTDSVSVYSLITKDTVDEKVHNILSKKEGTANYIVDNELDLHSHPELFDLLLSK